jgi:hypothetical protein
MSEASPTGDVRGVLHVDVAYDWGDEIDLARAGMLAPSEAQGLGNRPRTPVSIGYRPAPLKFPLPPLTVAPAASTPGVSPLPGDDGAIEAQAEVTVFDFGGVNVRIDVPLSAAWDELPRLAGDTATMSGLVRAARGAAEGLFERLKPAIQHPAWKEISEEYFVFHLDPATVPDPATLMERHSAWLAAILHMDAGPLSRDEIADALKQRISYAPGDLVAVDWAAAVVIDVDCEETLRTIEFANLQLLEFRHLDGRLDDALAKAYKLVHESLGRRLAFLRTHNRPLRALGDIRIETEMLFERAGNALKLVGDQYLSRLFSLLSARFHLDQWSESIHNTLEVAEGAYEVLENQASAARSEFMEIIVIGLIAFEIILTLIGH